MSMPKHTGDKHAFEEQIWGQLIVGAKSKSPAVTAAPPPNRPEGPKDNSLASVKLQPRRRIAMKGLKRKKHNCVKPHP